MTGLVTLVGAGPGAADLLTLRAAAALASADVVLVDRLVGWDVLFHVRPGAEVIDVGKRPGDDQTQERINSLMVEHARAGRRVVRLKGGDPMVFGRGAEEVGYVRERGIPVEIVPGVTSAIGVPTLAGIPVTLRGVAAGFAVVAGETLVRDDSFARYAAVDTLVVLMGVGRRRTIASGLMAAGRQGSEPVAFIEAGSTETQRIVSSTLVDVAIGGVDVDTPAVWVCGDVVRAAQAVIAEGSPS